MAKDKVEMIESEIFLIIDSDGEIYEENFENYSDAIDKIGGTGFSDPIIVGSTVTVPKSLFGPKIQVEINVPEGAFAPEPIQADLNEVSIPIELNEKKSSAVIKETLEDGKGHGIIALIAKHFKFKKGFGTRDLKDKDE